MCTPLLVLSCRPSDCLRNRSNELNLLSEKKLNVTSSKIKTLLPSSLSFFLVVVAVVVVAVVLLLLLLLLMLLVVVAVFLFWVFLFCFIFFGLKLCLFAFDKYNPQRNLLGSAADVYENITSFDD